MLKTFTFTSSYSFPQQGLIPANIIARNEAVGIIPKKLVAAGIVEETATGVEP
jgi:hypothetical protein